MLFRSKEVRELTGKSRSSIYRMFSAGELAYSVGRDGKRRVETSELLRVFDDINFEDSPSLAESEPRSASATPPPAGPDPYVTARELTDLRGMIHELKDELSDIREDNRRLLRLLEYQTVQSQDCKQATETASQSDATASVDSKGSDSGELKQESELKLEPEPVQAEEKVTKMPAVVTIPLTDKVTAEDEDGDEPSDDNITPVTEVAGKGWKQYREQRAAQSLEEKIEIEAEIEDNSNPSFPSSSAVNDLKGWLKEFFLGDWR